MERYKAESIGVTQIHPYLPSGLSQEEGAGTEPRAIRTGRDWHLY